MQAQKTLNANARAVLDALQATDTHPTALELYEAVRKVRPHIGLATVYRILRQLTEQGVICEIGDSESRYDAHTRRHDHAICTTCGALLDIPVDVSLAHESLQKAAQTVGLHLDSHEVRIYGQCANCQKKQ